MKVRIEVELDSLQEGDGSAVQAIQALAATIAKNGAPAPTPVKTPAAPKAAPTPKTTSAPAPEVPQAPAPAPAAGPTIADVRTALSQKVELHRDKIKAKLTELGAQNVSTLAPERYAEMLDFLNGLD